MLNNLGATVSLKVRKIKKILILGDMLDRILEESTNNIDIADAWVINAKNSLTNVHGFSPYQLAIGQNLILPCAATSRPPQLSHIH